MDLTRRNLLLGAGAAAASAAISVPKKGAAWLVGKGTSGDPDYSSVVFLSHFDGADGSTTIVDEKGHTVTANGNAQLDTAQQKFGSASCLFDGTGDYLSLVDDAAWTFTGDFTVEMWVRWNNLVDTAFAGQWSTSSATAGWLFARTAASGLVYNFYTGGGLLQSITGAWSPSPSVWYSICAERSGNDFRLYADGAVVGTATNANTPRNAALDLRIGGRNHTTPLYMDGWIDEMRITNGVARYSGAYTPATVAFPNF